MTDATTQISNVPASDFLIRGSDYLAQHPGFKLIGRDEELVSVSNVLMRKHNNNLIMHGANGVGISSILLGLQAAKESDDTPFDIVGKRFYYLDIDALFESGDGAKIVEGFQRTMATLKSQPDTVLIVEDVKDFLDGVRDNGVKNIINMLMREARTNENLQVIFETRDNSIGELMKAHSDILESFTILQIQEPSPKNQLDIVKAILPSLEEFHGVKISDEALNMVIELTAKYPGLNLNTAQPKRTTMILEGALTAYRHEMHSHPAMITRAERALEDVLQAEEGRGGPLEDKSANELAALKIERSAALEAARAGWTEIQAQLRKLYKDQRTGEQRIRELDAEVEAARKKAAEAVASAENRAESAAAQPAPEAAVAEAAPKTAPAFGRVASFTRMVQGAGIEGTAVTGLKDERTAMLELVAKSRDEYQRLTAELNTGLELRPEHVLGEFSRLSGVPMNKLQQDETQKLMSLEATMGQRVFGQDEPLQAVAKAVRRGRAGLKKPNKPIGSFLFMGPSGVGKTELAKALAEAMFGDERSLQIYNMSEYMEKHSSAKLIGSPPGYEGYEAGGLLTNAMRRQPYCVNVFDEMEKASTTVFDLFLQVLDEGRLVDNHGIESSFANSINIFTSNIGAVHFLNPDIEFEEAKKRALAELKDPAQSGLRPEFLNRFSGIFCFNRLGLPQIEMIAGKAFADLNKWVASKGIKVVISDEDKAAMCADHYAPENGARGIMSYILENDITDGVAETLLKQPDTAGTVQVTYDRATKSASMVFLPAEKTAKGPANQNTATAPAKKA